MRGGRHLERRLHEQPLRQGLSIPEGGERGNDAGFANVVRLEQPQTRVLRPNASTRTRAERSAVSQLNSNDAWQRKSDTRLARERGLEHPRVERLNAEAGEVRDSSQRLVHFKKTFTIAFDVLLDRTRLRATIVSVP